MANEAVSAAPPAGPRAAPRSEGYAAYLRALRRRTVLVQVWQIILLAAFFVLWEIAPRSGWIDPMLTSYPSAVAKTFMTLMSDNTLLLNTWGTVSSTAIGFA